MTSNLVIPACVPITVYYLLNREDTTASQDGYANFEFLTLRQKGKIFAPMSLKAFLISLGAIIALQGCSDDDDVHIYGRENRNQYDSRRDRQSAYHGYVGPSQDSFMFRGQHADMSAYPFTPRVPPPRMPEMDPRYMANLQGAQSRLDDRRDELNRVLHELDVDQRNYEESLRAVSVEYESTKERMRMEMDAYMNLMRNMASLQNSYPTSAVYANAFPPANYYSRPYVSDGLIKPFAIPSPPIVTATTQVTPTTPIAAPVTSATPVLDLSGYKDALTKFTDTCIVVAGQSRSGASIVSQLQAWKAAISTSTSQESLNAIASQINGILTQINNLPRKTVSEVWIDPTQVGSSSDRQKLNQLVRQEMESRVALNEPAMSTDGEVNSGSEIPRMFSYAASQSSRHHKLKVFRDFQSQQIRISATCNYRGFKSDSERDEHWYLSFTCDDSSKSLVVLGEKGRNRLSKAVLKVLCHSKEFSRRLVVDRNNRSDRCSIGKWREIAKGVGSAKYSWNDRSGKKYWKMLMEGSECFNKDEASINSNCGSKDKRFRFFR